MTPSSEDLTSSLEAGAQVQLHWPSSGSGQEAQGGGEKQGLWGAAMEEGKDKITGSQGA